MESRPKRNLNNPTLRGRLRSPRRAGFVDRPHEFQFNRNMTDIHGVPLGKTTSLSKATPSLEKSSNATVSLPSLQPVVRRSSSRASDIVVPKGRDNHLRLSKTVESPIKAPVIAKLDLGNITPSQGKPARVESGLTEGGVALATSREGRALSAEVSWSGDGGALRKSSKKVVQRLVDISLSTGTEKTERAEQLPKTLHIGKTQVRVLTPRPDLPKQKRSNVLRRQISKPVLRTAIIKHRRPIMPTILSGLAVVLFVAGILVLVNTLRTNHTVKAQVKQLAQKTQTDEGISEGTPSEVNPPSSAGNNDYQVSADLPRIVTIDKINVNARVRRVGIGTNNILNAPANIFDVGWYDGSAKPGENGTIVLDGHVSGPTKHGVFYSIGTLKPGDKIILERGDGKKLTYSVTGTELFDNDKVDMSKVLTSSIPGKAGLNLMTCAGRFNVRTNQFEQRVVVYTVQD